MDKTVIKNYAVTARKKLIEAVTLKAANLGIAHNMIMTPPEAEHFLQGKGIFLSNEESAARLRLNGIINMSQKDRDGNSKSGLNHVMENVAYTWFNRLIALRFMEINGYLPSNIRILSSEEPGRVEPEALREVDRLDFVKPSVVAKLKADPDFNASEKLYKHILISQCNQLSEKLPGMFQKINDYTELLLPDALYRKGGIVHDLVNAIPEDNFKSSVQIIGWLYQFYISEKKDEVFAGLKKNIKINKDTIPAATQLFTPEWIVKYMVENSLGRLWLEKHPNEDLRKNWKYYVDEAEQEPEVAERLRVMREQSPINKPEDISLIDPCMGSGHILVYAFDVLYQIYRSQGYHEREIPNLILQNNIYGLDIDDRAGQLAYFALMMKARGYNRRFLRQDVVPQPMVFTADGDVELSEFGSLVKVEELGEEPQLPEEMTLDNLGAELHHERDMIGWQYRSLLASKYDVVVTNPPYMGSSGMGAKLSDFVKKNYFDSKGDLFASFIEKCMEFSKSNGFQSMITQHSWMFLSIYEKLREKLMCYDVLNMTHLGARAFDEIGGEVVQTTAFVMRKSNINDYCSAYARLVDFGSQRAKESAFLSNGATHFAVKNNFKKIPGCPFAYWVSEKTLTAFESELFYEYSISDGQNVTSDNDKFVRMFWEVDKNLVGSENKWLLYAKGGGYRKWHGNLTEVIDWSETAVKYYRKNSSSRVIPEYLWYKVGITWSLITSNRPSFRKLPNYATFDKGGSSVFLKDYTNYNYFLALLNSEVFLHIVTLLNPTLNFQVKDIRSMPVIFRDVEIVLKLVDSCLFISSVDWNSFETSWNFKCHPFIEYKVFENRDVDVPNVDSDGDIISVEVDFDTISTIRTTFERWQSISNNNFNQLKSNEEELNRIFIDIYGLQDELTPEVEDKDVTIRKADLGRDIRSLLSYAVGCMFGRYSLDEPGLVFAGGIFDKNRYRTFTPVADNIIPIGVKEYLDNDIVTRFVDFVRTVYGEDTLEDNLDFIADALYPTGIGTARERIRTYFLKDFYKDHVKIYQKRPIYWLMDSSGSSGGSKKDGFKALFYLHRYDKFTITRARTDYLHPLQRKYDAEIKQLGILENEASSSRDKTNYRKEAAQLQVRLDECRAYDPIVSHFAHQQIELDLDDGVKVNYAKFQGVEVPMDDGDTVKMDLLAKM